MRQLQNRRGQGLIEYLVIVALVAVSSIVVMRAVGGSVNQQFSKVAKALGAKVEGDLRPHSISENMYKKKDLTNFLQGALEADKQRRGE
ncbi:MAG: hypothetical protein KF802_06700 [Bdellovibrionaceae bacterium]|nr:hypothetical protein [Pseudobdellovibrionaceae bacterium]MBX3034405.1 hypothetical protein [Pseudobdellovibrionaceae bacterium]